MSRFFGGVGQVGYVVRDIEKAMNIWTEKLGVGPWFYRKEVGITEFAYFGKTSELPKMSIALANSGDMQIELVQQHNDAPSLYIDTLRTNGESAQHIAYWTMDKFDEWCMRLIKDGFVEGHNGRMGLRGRFAYFIHPDLPSAMYEISETTGGKVESLN